MARKKLLKGKFKLGWPVINLDLGNSRQRLKFFTILAGLALLSILLIIGGFEGYHYTESAEFCGTVCHVMDPQFVRFETSEHANVECAKCHIGPGASFFVKSKIDGIRQVYAVLTDTYHRPIKSPVHNLRPARETCETCHSPTSFKDNIVKTIRHYEDDRENTPVQSTLILKMGGWQESTGRSEGIHWHVNSEVYYIAADEQRQVIIWVGVKKTDGTIKEYYARDMLDMAQTSFVEKAQAEGQMRLMDCIDCHNRTAHNILPPDRGIDHAIEVGLISTDIPYIRAKAVEVLSALYSNEVEAHAAIDGLAEYYQTTWLKSASSATSKVEKEKQLKIALDEIKRIYLSSNFPDMELDWTTNPNNAGHQPTPGCFRCHDDKHVSVDESGNEVETISVKCNLCHTVPIVGKGDEMLIEAPVIVGPVPESHSDYRFTIEHRSVDDAEKQGCFQCHGQAFCNNGACHNLSHPEDMLFTHADETSQRGEQVCYNCHQDVLCSRCHPGGIIQNP